MSVDGMKSATLPCVLSYLFGVSYSDYAIVLERNGPSLIDSINDIQKGIVCFSFQSTRYIRFSFDIVSSIGFTRATFFFLLASSMWNTMRMRNDVDVRQRDREVKEN